ncbi:MAG: hypothetical protein Tsb0021_15350 [Chlamydiales bacterium]
MENNISNAISFFANPLNPKNPKDFESCRRVLPILLRYIFDEMRFQSIDDLDSFTKKFELICLTYSPNLIREHKIKRASQNRSLDISEKPNDLASLSIRAQLAAEKCFVAPYSYLEKLFLEQQPRISSLMQTLTLQLSTYMASHRLISSNQNLQHSTERHISEINPKIEKHIGLLAKRIDKNIYLNVVRDLYPEAEKLSHVISREKLIMLCESLYNYDLKKIKEYIFLLVKEHKLPKQTFLVYKDLQSDNINLSTVLTASVLDKISTKIFDLFTSNPSEKIIEFFNLLQSQKVSAQLLNTIKNDASISLSKLPLEQQLGLINHLPLDEKQRYFVSACKEKCDILKNALLESYDELFQVLVFCSVNKLNIFSIVLNQALKESKPQITLKFLKDCKDFDLNFKKHLVTLFPSLFISIFSEKDFDSLFSDFKNILYHYSDILNLQWESTAFPLFKISFERNEHTTMEQLLSICSQPIYINGLVRPVKQAMVEKLILEYLYNSKYDQIETLLKVSTRFTHFTNDKKISIKLPIILSELIQKDASKFVSILSISERYKNYFIALQVTPEDFEKSLEILIFEENISPLVVKKFIQKLGFYEKIKQIYIHRYVDLVRFPLTETEDRDSYSHTKFLLRLATKIHKQKTFLKKLGISSDLTKTDIEYLLVKTLSQDQFPLLRVMFKDLSTLNSFLSDKSFFSKFIEKLQSDTPFLENLLKYHKHVLKKSNYFPLLVKKLIECGSLSSLRVLNAYVDITEIINKQKFSYNKEKMTIVERVNRWIEMDKKDISHIIECLSALGADLDYEFLKSKKKYTKSIEDARNYFKSNKRKKPETNSLSSNTEKSQKKSDRPNVSGKTVPSYVRLNFGSKEEESE